MRRGPHPQINPGTFPEHESFSWPRFADNFYQEFLDGRLRRQQFTTQVEHYDDLAAICDTCKRINTILVDLSRDMWQYISAESFTQQHIPTEVGSSAMPHKVNPIDFENAEGNLLLASAVFEFLSAKLPVSRLQRDLSDSTVRRNVGVPFGHSLMAFASLERGLRKVKVNKRKLDRELEENWAVVAEAVQTVLRREGFPAPYEALKAFTRGKEGGIGRDEMKAFVETSLEGVPEEVKKRLLGMTPETYAKCRQVPEIG